MRIEKYWVLLKGRLYWKTELKMEKLYQPYINLMIYSSFPKCTFSDNFTFWGKFNNVWS